MDAIGKSDMQSEEEMENLKRGPWTLEEDFALINYISNHGEGRWNSLSRCAGLKRTGKSCRLRWLNYLRPDVRRGNITLEEQLIILELHSRWGNRWSKIAQHLPGRTDNEIKNYWRTRVQKHAKQLKCDVNSKQFKDTMRYVWMPRLVERIQAAAATTGPSSTATAATSTTTNSYDSSYNNNNNMDICNSSQVIMPNDNMAGNFGGENIINQNFTPDNTSSASDLTDCYNYPVNHNENYDNLQPNQLNFAETLTSPSGYFNQPMDFQSGEHNNPCFVDGGELYDNFWNAEDIWLLQQQFSNNI